ncbi:UNVERIFIED_CONTAM: hypothetical protein RMT77_014929 [Armadillidium vulgare]
MATPAKVKMKYLIPKVVLIELKLSDSQTYQKDLLDKGTASSDDGGPGEKSQFIEIQKSKYPVVVLKDLKYTHKKILEKCLKKYYRKRLRQSHHRKEKSSYSRRNLRSRRSNICAVIDLTADDEDSEMSDNNCHRVSDSDNEEIDSIEVDRLKNKCHQGKKSVVSNINLEPKSSSITLKDFHIKAKFKCSDCSYKTKYKESYNAHCAKHKNIKLFKCDDCDFESNYRKGLIRHNLNRCPKKAELKSNENCVVNQSKNSQYFSLSLSEIMILIFNNRKSLDENASVPSPTEPLKCSECSFKTENPKYLEFHSQIHSEVQKCPECGYESTDTNKFKNHLIKIHLDESTTESESAPYSFRKRSRQSNKTVVDDSSDEWHSEMSDIKIEESSDDDQPLTKKKFKCLDCTYATSNNEDFVAHCLDHANKTLFKCEHCDFKTNYERSLKNHNLKCLKNQGNSLSDCFNKAIDESVDYHSLSLSEIINLICNQDKSLDHNTSDETTTEVLKCLECTFVTGDQKIFNFHSQIHVEVKKCSECNIESADIETFKDHIISHFKHKNIKEQKMFKCCECSYKTKYKTSFDAHCAKHKNIKLFKCDNCDFESNYKRALVSHNLNHCPKKTELNSIDNCFVNQSKNSQYFSLPLSEIMLLIFTKMKSLDENASVPSPAEILKCPECSFETENPKYLEYHSQIHSDIQKCPECGYESTDTDTFRDHLITHLDESTGENESVSYSFRKRSRPSNKTIKEESSDEEYIEYDPEYEESDIELMDEMPKRKKPLGSFITHSQKIRDYTCDKCDFKADSYPSFVSHILDHNDEKSDSFDITAHLDNLKDYSFSDIISMICSDDKNLNSETKLHKCSQCSFEISDEVQLSLHLSSHSTEEKFICSQCSFEGSNQSDLDSHLQTHSTFKCSKCSYESYENGILSLHCCEFKSDKVFKCSKCSYECSDIDVLNLHSCECNSDKVFKCLRCNFETKKEKHLTLHSQLHAKLRKCTECSYSHHSKDKFKEHLLSHLPTKLYICSECSYKTNFIRKFKLHLLNHTNIRVFNCPHCDYKTNYKDSLKYHIESHLEVKSYRCTECDYSTSQSNSLRLHILNHGQTKQFLCSDCDYGCNNKARMMEHMKQHSNERPFKCSQCDFSTKYKKQLKLHKARHDGKFSFACSQCDYKGLTQYRLKRHSLKHTNTKLYKCPECSYQCNANLKLHMINMHTKTKMLKCSQCKYESNHKSNYLTHLRTHSDERKYSCTECSFASKRKDNLKVHMKTHLKKNFSDEKSAYVNKIRSDEGSTYVNKNSDEGNTYVNKNHSDEGNIYVNEHYSDEGSTYVNENYSDEGNTYVNENHSDAGNTYVNENHSDEGNTYVNEHYSDEGSTYVNFNHSDDLSVLIDESLNEVNAFISETVNVG